MNTNNRAYYDGLLTGITLGLVIMIAILGPQQSRRNAAIDQCEDTLPRTQTCVLVAVPKHEVQVSEIE